MIHSKFTPLLLFLLLGLVLAGCGGDATPTPAAAAPTSAAAAEAEVTPTPAAADTGADTGADTDSPLAAPGSPLAAPSSPLPTPEVTPEMADETGAIMGRIVVMKPEGEIPLTDVMVGLADVITGESGLPEMSGYEPSRALRVDMDAYGRFVMSNVKPGTYTLILDAVVEQFQLEDQEKGITIVAEVKPGELIDLGTLTYSSLPLPGLR